MHAFGIRTPDLVLLLKLWLLIFDLAGARSVDVPGWWTVMGLRVALPQIKER